MAVDYENQIKLFLLSIPIEVRTPHLEKAGLDTQEATNGADRQTISELFQTMLDGMITAAVLATNRFEQISTHPALRA